MKILTAHPRLFKEDELIDSHISFGPYIRYMKEKAARTTGARASYFSEIVRHFESDPALLQPLEKDTDISRYQEYLDLITATVFPVTIDDTKDIYGIGAPFRFAIFYYSEQFRQLFTDNGHELMASQRRFGRKSEKG